MPGSSSSSVKVFFLDRTRVLAQLEKALEALLAHRPEVLEVWLFGSFARGRSAPGSDLDLALVLSPGDLRPWPERMSSYLPYFRDVAMPVDLFCYTIPEWEGSRDLPFFQEIRRGQRQR